MGGGWGKWEFHSGKLQQVGRELLSLSLLACNLGKGSSGARTQD